MGTITGPGTLYVTARMVWSGGTMSGAGTTWITAPAHMVVVSSTTLTMDGRTLQNSGTVSWQGANAMSQTWDLQNGATIVNGGIFQIVTDVGFESIMAEGNQMSLSGGFDNTISGTVIQSGFGDGAQIQLNTFTNNGVVQVDSGELLLGGPPPFSENTYKVDSAGTFVAADDTSVVFETVQLTFHNPINDQGDRVLTGAGWYLAQGSTVAVDAGVTVGADNFQLVSGTLSGPGTFEAHDFVWSDGTMTGGTTLVAAGDYLSIQAPTPTISGCTLQDSGYVAWQATAGNIALGPNGWINIVGGTFDAFTDATILNANAMMPSLGVTVGYGGLLRAYGSVSGGLVAFEVNVVVNAGGSIYATADTYFTAQLVSTLASIQVANTSFVGGFVNNGSYLEVDGTTWCGADFQNNGGQVYLFGGASVAGNLNNNSGGLLQATSDLTVSGTVNNSGSTLQVGGNGNFGGAFTNTGSTLQVSGDGNFGAGFSQTGANAMCQLAGGTYQFTNTSASLGGMFIMMGGTMINFGGLTSATSQNTTFELAGSVSGGLRLSNCTIWLTGNLSVTSWVDLWGCNMYLGGNSLNVGEAMDCENLGNVRNAIYFDGGTLTTVNGFSNEGDLYGPGTLNGRPV